MARVPWNGPTPKSSQVIPIVTRTKITWPHFWRFLFILYMAGVTLIAYWPSPVDKPLTGQLFGTFAFLYKHGVPRWFDYHLVESASNALLFVPFGLLMTMCFPAKGWWLTIVLGFLASCGMEVGQLLFLSERFPSMWDVAANTTGTAIGVAIARFCLKTFRGRTGPCMSVQSQA